MADLSVTPVAAGIKPVPTMSLGDMVDLARGTQAYQQAEQINPLLLQLRKQEARTGQIALSVKEQENLERLALQDFFSKPDNYQTEGRIDLDKINEKIPKIAPLTGTTAINTFTTLQKAQTEATSAKQNLTQDQRAMIGSVFTVLGRMGVNDKAEYIKALDTLGAQNPGNKDFQTLIKSYKTIWENLPATDLPKVAISGGQTLLSPAQLQTALAPEIGVTAEGRTTIKKPSVGTEPPTISFGTAGGVQTGTETPAGLETKAAPSKGAGMMLPYPVRSATQKYIPEPSEEKDAQAGIDYRTNLVNRQVSLPTDRRNAEEAISKAKQILEDLKFKGGGVAGTIESKIRMAISNTDYAALAKDLANLQISNSKTLGVAGNTVAGLDLTKVASGDISVPPKVLIEIARRAQADMTNIDMQAQGAQQFKLRFGDNNMKAFQQAWNANADTKVFQVMNIYKEITDPTKRKEAIDKLLGSDPEKRKQYYDKYNNIKQLTATGGL